MCGRGSVSAAQTLLSASSTVMSVVISYVHKILIRRIRNGLEVGDTLIIDCVHGHCW
jgi:hypothetical protein